MSQTFTLLKNVLIKDMSRNLLKKNLFHTRTEYLRKGSLHADLSPKTAASYKKSLYLTHVKPEHARRAMVRPNFTIKWS